MYCIRVRCWMGQLPKHEEEGKKRFQIHIYTSQTESKPIHSMYSVELCVSDICIDTSCSSYRFGCFSFYCRFTLLHILYCFICCEVWQRASVFVLYIVNAEHSLVRIELLTMTTTTTAATTVVVGVIAFSMHACVCVSVYIQCEYNRGFNSICRLYERLNGRCKKRQNQMFVLLSSNYIH